jgi:hypothetical protein
LVNELQGKIQVLQRRSFYAQTQIDQAEADNEEARTAAEESALESERSVDNFRNIIEEEGYIESRENRIRSILENPSNIRAVINKEELLGIFSSEDRGALINADINFQDINPNLRSDKDIIMSFPGHLNAHDITFLPHSLLADENFHFTMSTITKSLMI